MRPLVFSAIAFSVLLLNSCANKVMPTGGDKDVLPPVLLNATPENFQKNFSSKKIVLTFNEFVQLKDVQKQVMISPPMKPAPQMEVRKKSIVITFDDTLRTNTTYTLNFGNAIADFTEANPLPGYQYVFSTGPEMDSLVIDGVMLDALTRKPVKEALALLYDSGVADTSIGKIQPMYYARTGIDGRFRIRNVREGAYRLVGLDDKNNNFTAEFADEAIGVGTDIIYLKDSALMNAYLSLQPPALQAIKSSQREAPGKLITVFTRPVLDLNWTFLSPQPGTVIPQISSNRDTVILFCLTETQDSIQVVWRDGESVIDTAVYRSYKSKQSDRGTQVSKASGATYPAQGAQLLQETNPYVNWTAPLRSIDFNKVTVLKDSVNFPVKPYFEDSVNIKTVFSADWKEGSYHIMIAAEAAEDLYGRLNDTVKFSFTVPAERTRGSISYSFAAKTNDNALLQLVTDKDVLVRQRKVSGTQQGVFEQVEPGQYRLRLVYDVNNNERWDAGDIRRHISPEQVNYYNDPITVRANWEVEVEWTE